MDYAIVQNGLVQNIIIANSPEEIMLPEGGQAILLENSTPSIGDSYYSGSGRFVSNQESFIDLPVDDEIKV